MGERSWAGRGEGGRGRDADRPGDRKGQAEGKRTSDTAGENAVDGNTGQMRGWKR